MKVAVFITIALILLIVLLLVAAVSDKHRKITNWLAITVATCIITLLYLINS